MSAEEETPGSGRRRRTDCARRDGADEREQRRGRRRPMDAVTRVVVQEETVRRGEAPHDGLDCAKGHAVSESSSARGGGGGERGRPALVKAPRRKSIAALPLSGGSRSATRRSRVEAPAGG